MTMDVFVYTILFSYEHAVYFVIRRCNVWFYLDSIAFHACAEQKDRLSIMHNFLLLQNLYPVLLKSG